MKLFVVSDVHSFFDEMMTALSNCGYDKSNPEHIFVSCGDLFDRGPSPSECLSFVNSLEEDRKVLILGNHEDLMQEAIQRGFFESHDFHNKTFETVYKLTKSSRDKVLDYVALKKMSRSRNWKKYVGACRDYAEIGDYIFVHGWIPVGYKHPEGTLSIDDLFKDYYSPEYFYNPDWRHSPWLYDWREARWFNGMEMWSLGIREPNKTIVCGHYHTSWGHANLKSDGVEFLNEVETYYIDPDTGRQEPHCNLEPFEDDGIIAIDACTAYSGKVNCKVLDVSKEEWKKYLNENSNK